MTDAAEPAPPPKEPTEEPQVEFHAPKPIHNWRDFLKEVGTIVLGVCIALAAEQGVEYVHWRSQVDKARQTFATEMAFNTASAISRLRSFSCTEDRLDALAKILDEASRTGKIIALRLDRCIARGLVCSASEVLDKDPSDHHPMVLDMKVDAREEGALFAG